MRYLFLFFLLSLFTITSCSTDEESNDLTGTWQLDTTSGTITGKGITTDWNKMIVSDKATKFYKNNNLVEEGKIEYSHDTKLDIHKVKFLFSNTNSTVLDLKEDPEKQIKLSSSKKLHLISDCCDRVDYHLSKIE
jgi:hypothetical protein